jgi:hypothetical protein
MVKVFEQLRSQQGLRSKRGIGITEVLIAAAVLGFLYMAVLNLEGGNHDALLRIRGRDGATEVAQNLIDSLGSLGLASLSDKSSGKVTTCGENCWTLAKSNGAGGFVQDTIKVKREWTGQPGILEHKMTVKYKALVYVSPDSNYQVRTTSTLLGDDSVTHVFAKRLDVKVSWCFKCPHPDSTNQSITVSGVVR